MILRVKKRYLLSAVVFLCISVCLLSLASAENEPMEKKYIKWAQFNVCLDALEDAMELDIKTYDTLYHIPMADTLAYLALENGDSWDSYSKGDVDSMLERLSDIYTIDELVGQNQYFRYYRQVFTAVVGGLLGEYAVTQCNGRGEKETVKKYGLVAFSPIADGFYYSHYDDFGNARNYGYKRQHLGNDLMGSIGTPIVAVEGGTVESIGWNQYGGWRIGIRSYDKKRSYYYAHLRKDTPYHTDIKPGCEVKAGQVIGYMGMTGYSVKSNVNGMSTPHLHLGMQLIFDESQKEGENQIWLDMYTMVKFLSKNKAAVIRDEKTGQYYTKEDI